MNIGIFEQYGALNSAPIFAAFKQGLNKLGIKHSHHDHQADVAVIWSQVWAGRMKSNLDIWNEFRSTQRPVIVLEVGSIQRGITWKIGVNGIGSGCYSTKDLDFDRVEKLNILLCPWRLSGQYILIVCQRTDSEQWQGQPTSQQWLMDTVKQLRYYTDRPIVIRPHPRERLGTIPGALMQKPQRIEGTYDDFDFLKSLKQAWAVVNWNSGTGPQSIINGVPAFVSKTSLAAPVANTAFDQIETPNCPDRSQWLLELAHTEWTVEEIATGYPIKRILSLI